MNSSPAGALTRWQAYGTTFESDIELRQFTRTDAEPHVTVRLGTAPRHLDSPAYDGPFWSATAHEVLISTPGIARCHVQRGCSITIDAVSDAGRHDDLLYGVPMASCLMQRGVTVLHGSAVEFPFGALVVTGPGGAGKSSLVSALAQRSFTALCDNLAAIDLIDDRPRLRPGPPSVRLWGDMADALGYDVADAAEVRDRMNKFIFPTSASSAREVSLGAVVCLEPTTTSEPLLTRLDRPSAVSALVRDLFRARLARVVASDLLGDLTAIASTVPTFRLERPQRGFGPGRLADFVIGELA